MDDASLQLVAIEDQAGGGWVARNVLVNHLELRQRWAVVDLRNQVNKIDSLKTVNDDFTIGNVKLWTRDSGYCRRRGSTGETPIARDDLNDFRIAGI